MDEIKTIGIVGTGVIGTGWAARCLARGLDVVAWDPAPHAETKLRTAVDNAWPALSKLGLLTGADRSRLRCVNALEDVCRAADFIQESAPENEDLKRALHAQIDAAARPDIIVASSSSGLLPTRIQADCRHPERVVIGHPFNPVYLLPLVEVLGGKRTSDDAVERAVTIYESFGMHALKVRNEIEGYLSDRLQEALWREILHLVNDGVATTEELDAAIAYGPGLRWAFMGACLTFHMAGGDGGMRHMLDQFGPALKLPWTRLEAPELTDELIERMASGTEKQAAGRTVKELEQLRDNCLIAIMRALQPYDIGAGHTLAKDEGRRLGKQQSQGRIMTPYEGMGHRRWQAGEKIDAPLTLHETPVRPEWVDYNGHMSESCYLLVFGDASDAFFRYFGIDESYRSAGKSIYTVESHINYYRDVSEGEPITVSTQLLDLDEKRLHIFHSMVHREDGGLLATTEQMLLHVDTTVPGVTAFPPDILERLQAIRDAHAQLPQPEQVGRVMHIKRKAK